MGMGFLWCEMMDDLGENFLVRRSAGGEMR